MIALAVIIWLVVAVVIMGGNQYALAGLMRAWTVFRQAFQEYLQPILADIVTNFYKQDQVSAMRVVKHAGRVVAVSVIYRRIYGNDGNAGVWDET
jgi:hypothetical protein